MPRDKDLKRLVRARMHKTGESYTTARAQLTGRKVGAAVEVASAPPSPVIESSPVIEPSPVLEPPPVEAVAPTSADLAAIAGRSDETMVARTGCTWERWVYALDRHRAYELPHRDIAALVADKYRTDGWWAQTVTVGYERIKGLRERGQRRDGGFEASKSRTFPVPVTTLFDACADPAKRRTWLADADPEVTSTTRPRSLRWAWGDGTRVQLWFEAKGDAKSTVAVAHTKLPDQAARTRVAAEWGERLSALGEALGS